jgi:ABC-2 type transport system ATP-binding protein
MDVSLRGVRKTYRGGITALDRLDLDIPPGMLGVLGPNGAGKTTLMRILAGVSRPDRGSVRAGGWDLARPRDRRRFQERLGYLPRDLGLYPELTGRRFLDYAGTLKGMSSPRRRHRQVDAVLHLAGLEEVADRPAGGYSGGMRRRLGLAQALLNDPAVLLLDEPTAGLDPEEQTRVRMLLASLAGQRTVVLATRDAADVSSTCRRCVVLAGGRMIFEGEAAGLARAAEGLVWSVQTDRPLSALQAASVASAVRLPDRTVYRVISPAPPLPSARPLRPGLEDGYLALIRQQARAPARALPD